MSERRRSARESGQALVEFAIVLPIIVLLTLGTLDFGRAVFVYNALSEASRQGARTAIVHQNASVVAQTAVNFAPTTALTTADVEHVQRCRRSGEVEQREDELAPVALRGIRLGRPSVFLPVPVPVVQLLRDGMRHSCTVRA